LLVEDIRGEETHDVVAKVVRKPPPRKNKKKKPSQAEIISATLNFEQNIYRVRDFMMNFMMIL